jgi:hypothetical protein
LEKSEDDGGETSVLFAIPPEGVEFDVIPVEDEGKAMSYTTLRPLSCPCQFCSMILFISSQEENRGSSWADPLGMNSMGIEQEERIKLVRRSVGR